MPSKRDRYENANMRGGMGVRKRLSEDSLKTSYRLNGVQTGSAVVRKVKLYGTWAEGHYIGVIVRRTAGVVQVRWWGNDELFTYSQAEARYEVDRDRWKILGVLRGDPLDPTANPLTDALTSMLGEHRMMMSAAAGSPTPPTEENEGMESSRAAAERKAAQAQVEGGSLKDRDTYTAKQVATRCGTDAKTMRKFFRSSHSTVEAVGQGGRYEFAAKDLPKIQKEFEAWRKHASSSRTPIHSPAAKKLQESIHKGKSTDPVPESQAVEDDDWTPDTWGTPMDREPTREELTQLDDLDLDLDDLDAADD